MTSPCRLQFVMGCIPRFRDGVACSCLSDPCCIAGGGVKPRIGICQDWHPIPPLTVSRKYASVSNLKIKHSSFIFTSAPLQQFHFNDCSTPTWSTYEVPPGITKLKERRETHAALHDRGPICSVESHRGFVLLTASLPHGFASNILNDGYFK
jgi:hypothetical protein